MTLSSAAFRQRIMERLRAEAFPPAEMHGAVPLKGWDPQSVTEYLNKELGAESREMEQVVIIGAGGHAKVIIEILEEAGEVKVVGCTSKAPAGRILDVPVLGDDSILPKLHADGVRAAFVALGNNRLRQQVIRQLRQAGFRLISAISPRAIISPRVRLGEGVAVMAGVVINVDTVIGEGAIVNTGATVDHDCHIGACAHVAPGVNLAGCVAVGEGAFLGIGSRAIPGVSIGPWATVGAGGVVIRDIPEGVTAVGVPAACRAGCP